MTIFHSGVTDVPDVDTRESSETLCDPGGIGSRLLQPQVIVLALTVGFEAEFLNDLEVLRRATQVAANDGLTVSALPFGQGGIVSSLHW